MTDNKKKRMMMLDGLTPNTANTPSGAPMMSTNRALRSARDAVDAHRVWELDPASITDQRVADRIETFDVVELRRSIETNGQAVPILVRRDPSGDDKYLLVYGRRRLEAIKGSERVSKVRAVIASLDETAAIRAQVTENTERRDLSYIERALFAKELHDGGYGTQDQIADLLNSSKSSISMALSVARTVGNELAQAIGAAELIGRPRWESLAKGIADAAIDPSALVDIARSARQKAAEATEGPDEATAHSNAAFAAVLRVVTRSQAKEAPSADAHQNSNRFLSVDGRKAGKVTTSSRGIRLEFLTQDPEFATWISEQADTVLQEIHDRWSVLQEEKQK